MILQKGSYRDATHIHTWASIDKGIVEGKRKGGGDGDEMKKLREAVAANVVRGRVRGVQEG